MAEDLSRQNPPDDPSTDGPSTDGKDEGKVKPQGKAIAWTDEELDKMSDITAAVIADAKADAKRDPLLDALLNAEETDEGEE